MAQNPPYRSGFVIQPQQQQQQQYTQYQYDPRHQFPQYQPPRQPTYPQYQQQPQPQYYQQQAPVAQHRSPHAPRSSLGHGHSHSVPGTHFVNPPPLSPSALQAQAAQAQAQLQARGRPLPPAAPSAQASSVTQYAQQQQPSHSIPVPLNRSPSSSASSRPLPVPTPSTGVARSPTKHQSIDLGRFSSSPQPTQPVSQPAQFVSQPAKPAVRPTEPSPPETPSQIRRRASPPRFTGGSGSWSEPPPLALTTKSPSVPSTNAYKDLLSGQGSTLESGKFVPLWKRGLITNGEPSSAASSGRPLPSAPSKGTSAVVSGLKRGGSLHVRAPATISASKSPSPSPEPSDESETESHIETHGNVEGESEESESESEVSGSEDASSDAESSNAEPPSASYGIRDLPRPPSIDARTTSLPQPPEIRASAFEGRSAPGMIESGGSRTLMYAAASLKGTPVKNTWPNGIPPLPRTPAIRGIGDLEDSPPVSTIRKGVGNGAAPVTKSASSFSGPPASPLSKPSSFSSTGPPSSSQIPSFSFSGPSSPPKSSKVPSISFTAPSFSPQIPSISFPDESPSPQVSVPQINLPGDDDGGPMINIQDVDSKPAPVVFEVPGISFSGMGTSSSGPVAQRSLPTRPPNEKQRRGLACGGCNGSIVGRIVNAMNLRWHPECFRCTVCGELLEHVSSYERDGKAYCHLDYHENFAPRCYSCKTAIVEERFISLDDPQLGKRTYHEQHFFCAECGDPFLPPSLPASKGEIAFSGDGAFVSDDVGFTVYRGHPYCEACHVRLRLPKCKKCKRSIRDGDEAVEALGGKWCWRCFTCAGCDKPFEDPSFFEREGKPWFDSIVNTYLIQRCGLDPATSPYIGLVISSFCEFFTPLSFPHFVDLGLRVIKLGNSSVTYEVGVFAEGGNEPAAVGGYTHVFVERRERKSAPMVSEMREGLSKLLSDPSSPAKL
ncbi:Flap endonuclease 1 [Mycena sanguinolenta]|uniref:Flap endonuclease 1 n=1 Tax=Mycena sanguinolenta TaxID=230812 RepID=A0A8H7DJU2_9AGAR|nr:Flap endonuclease 1 [Mycena sanguinolenta]